MIAYIIVALIDHPIINLMDNTTNLAKWSTCVAQVGIKQSVSASEVITTPMRQIFVNYFTDLAVSPFIFNETEADFEETIGEVSALESSDPQKSSVADYKQKMSEKCDSISEKVKNCYSNFVAPNLNWWSFKVNFGSPTFW